MKRLFMTILSIQMALAQQGHAPDIAFKNLYLHTVSPAAVATSLVTYVSYNLCLLPYPYACGFDLEPECDTCFASKDDCDETQNSSSVIAQSIRDNTIFLFNRLNGNKVKQD